MILKLHKLIKKYYEIIKYLIAGALTVLVNLITYYLCTLVWNINEGIFLHLSNIIAWIMAVIFAYWINKEYVFNYNTKDSKMEKVKFFASRITTLIIELILMYLFVFTFKMNDKIAKVIVQIIVIALNYVFSKYFVFIEKSQ